MSDDPFDSPEWQEYAQHVREELLPKIEESAIGVSLYNGALDPKLAIETGYLILLDKPIIAVVTPGAKVPRSWRWWPTRSSSWLSTIPRSRSASALP